MNTINCHVCGRHINWHTDHNDINSPCTETPESIATRAVEEAIAEARKVIEPFAEAYEFNKVGLSVPQVLINVMSVDAEKASLWLASHPSAQEISADGSDTSLPKAVTWNEAMQGREQDFNKRYYNNPDGKPEWGRG